LAGCLDADEMAHFIGHASDCRANMQQSATPIEYDARGFIESGSSKLLCNTTQRKLDKIWSLFRFFNGVSLNNYQYLTEFVDNSKL
jgi:hypothetical protein